MRPRPVAITELPPSPEQEQRSRMIKYAITMGIRMVCLAGCLVVPGWWVLIPAAGAIFLPWVAVVIANAAVGGAGSRVERPGAILPVQRDPE